MDITEITWISKCAVLSYFEVAMRSGTPSGRSHLGDNVALLDFLSYFGGFVSVGNHILSV